MTTKMSFAPFPYTAIDDQRLTEIDLKVLSAVALHDRFGKNGQACFAARDRLAKETGFNASNVSTSLSKLAKLGYLKTSARRSDGRKNSYSVVYGTPRRFAKIPAGAISDRYLTKTLFRTLAVISAHDSGKERGCFATVSTLAQRAGLDTKTVECGIAALVNAGYVFASVSPISPARETLYVSAWRQDADPQIQTSRSEEATGSEFDFDGAVRERLPYGAFRRGSQLRAEGLLPIESNTLGKPIYWSEDLPIKNPAEADPGENATSHENPFNEAVKTMEVLGVDQTVGWRILQGLPEPELYPFLAKAGEGCLTLSDVAVAKNQAFGHIN